MDKYTPGQAGNKGRNGLSILKVFLFTVSLTGLLPVIFLLLGLLAHRWDYVSQYVGERHMYSLHVLNNNVVSMIERETQSFDLLLADLAGEEQRNMRARLNSYAKFGNINGRVYLFDDQFSLHSMSVAASVKGDDVRLSFIRQLLMNNPPSNITHFSLQQDHNNEQFFQLAGRLSLDKKLFYVVAELPVAQLVDYIKQGDFAQLALFFNGTALKLDLNDSVDAGFDWMNYSVINPMSQNEAVQSYIIEHIGDDRIGSLLENTVNKLQILEYYPANLFVSSFFAKNSSLMLWVFAGLGLALGFGIFVAKWVDKPLGSLIAATSDLIMHDLKGNLPDICANAPTEIRQLHVTISMLTNGFRQSLNMGTKLNESLQLRVDEATEQLREANTRLELALANAEQASKAKGVFLANMSHELRTPMNAILGYSQMLEEIAVEEKLSEFIPDLKKIQVSGQHLLSLINDILDLSKIEAGKMEFYYEWFDLKQLIEDVQVTIEPSVVKNNNRFVLNNKLVNNRMFADQVKMKQVIINLLSNSAKFTSDGEVELAIEATELNKQETIKFIVRDSGIGMTREQVKKLFQEFTQADSSTTRRFGGTGLGLAISRRFVRMMGGDILVNSEQNVGSTFTVYVPRQAIQPELGSGDGGEAVA